MAGFYATIGIFLRRIGVGSNSCCDGMCLQLHCSRVCCHLQWHGVKGRLDSQKANTFNVSRGEELPLPMILKTVFHVNTPELLATDLDNFINCETILSFSKPP